jgi:cysteine desulfurase
MVEWLDQVGDPGRLYEEGLTARHALEQARDQVAGLFGARNREVCFTSGATEAIAAACWGAAERGGHQVVPAVEHSAVRLSAERHGSITLVAPDGRGRVDAAAVLAAIRADTALVHIQWGNHEVATLQPVGEVVAACRERGVLVHVDAAQAAGHAPIDFRSLGADLLSISAHKLGGPVGAGALLIRRGVRLRPLLVGSDQERARRAGIENLPALVGFGAACAALAEPGRLDAEATLERRLNDRIINAVGEPGSGLDGLELYGDPQRRLPHLVCLGVQGIEPQAVLLGLDRAGISAHSGSACASEGLEPSPVLEAMGVDAHHSLRISTGWTSTDDDVDRLLDVLPAVLDDLRALDPRTRYRPPSS